MRKILNNGFKSFLCSKYVHYELNISCINQQGQIFHNWHYFHGKKIAKRCEKNHRWESLIQWIMGLFLDLIPFTYKGIT